MPLYIQSKELKELLKNFTKLSRISSNAVAPITFTFEPFQAIMMTEHAFIISQPTVSIVPPINTYTFNPEILLDLAMTEGDVELHWENETSALNMKNNYLRTALRVAVPRPEFIEMPEGIMSIEVPLGLLYAVEKYINLPHLYITSKKELTSIWFRKNSKGNLEICTDDDCSLARINTTIPVKLKSLDFKVPRYIIEALYSKGSLTDTTPVRIGVHGSKSLFSNVNTQIYSSSTNDESMDTFDAALDDFKPMVSCDFVPKKLSDAIKPLVSLIPKKDKGSNIVVNVNAQKMSMSILHQDVGEGIIDTVDGISNIYLENSAKSIPIKMVPQIFQVHTDLLNISQATMSANNSMVYYKGKCNVGDYVVDVEYLFPTSLGQV